MTRPIPGYCGCDHPRFHDVPAATMPRDDGPAVALFAELGWRVVSDYLFPLGSDKPEPRLRHDTHYGGRLYPASMWRFVRLETEAVTV